MTVDFTPNSGQRLETLEAVRLALLTRVPEAYRDSFFTPFHPQELTPEHLQIDPAQLSAAANLLQTASENQSKVLIYGDYDCDGVTSTAILWQTLRSRGLTATPFVPRRDVYGYGMSVKALQDLWKAQSFDLVITVDNGILAHEAISWAKSQGAQVIVTDHHQASSSLPEADAIVHSPLLCGAGVVWALCRELDSQRALSHLDLVTIATLADQVPLLGANRSLVVHGMQALRQTQRSSLTSLASLAGVDLATLTPNGVTFSLAPRLNAMGRLADPMDALRALVSQSPNRIQQLLLHMERTNQERQKLTQELYEQVHQQAEKNRAAGAEVLVVHGPYHEGVIGLLASKLVEQYHRPAIVVSTLGECWKGSCRSVAGFNIIESLREVEDVDFVSLGGHAQAAGFSLNPSNAETFLAKIQTILSEKYTNTNLKPNIDCIGTLSFDLLIPELVSLLQEYEPFGSGNSEPCFLLQDIRFTSLQFVGRQKQHWKGTLFHPHSGLTAPAIYFKAAEKCDISPDSIRHAVVRVSPSSYGSRGFDIHIVHAFGDEIQKSTP